jgi:hypothetical protein
MGQLIMLWHHEKGVMNVDVRSLPNGSYVLSFESGFYQRFVISH